MCLRSASIGQPQRLSLTTKLAEQDKRLSKCKLCDLFGVVRSSYYYGIKTRPIDIERIKLKALIHQIFNDSKQSAGAVTPPKHELSVGFVIIYPYNCGRKADDNLKERVKTLYFSQSHILKTKKNLSLRAEVF